MKASGGRLGRGGFGWRRAEAVDDAGRRVRETVLCKLAVPDRALAVRESGATSRAIAATLNAEAPESKHGGAGIVRAVLLQAARAAAETPH